MNAVISKFSDNGYRHSRESVDDAYFEGDITEAERNDVFRAVESANKLLLADIPSDTVLASDLSAVCPAYALYRKTVSVRAQVEYYMNQYARLYGGQNAKSRKVLESVRNFSAKLNEWRSRLDLPHTTQDRHSVCSSIVQEWKSYPQSRATIAKQIFGVMDYKLLEPGYPSDAEFAQYILMESEYSEPQFSMQDPADVEHEVDPEVAHNNLSKLASLKSVPPCAEPVSSLVNHANAAHIGNRARFVSENLRMMRESQNYQRRREFEHRLLREMEECHAKDWFIIFDSLTVDNENYTKVFLDDRESSWQKYIDAWKFGIRKALGDDDRKLKTSEFHRYAAVVELGGKTGRAHYHVVHMCKALPDGCSDPTGGVRNGHMRRRREIDHLKSFWEYGNSIPLPVRTGPLDVYANLGWQWPYDKRTGRPLVVYPLFSMARYIGKYLSEGFGDPRWKDSDIPKHRTKMSQGLGLTAYRRMVEDLPTDALMSFCQTTELLKELEIPGGGFDRPHNRLIRRAALREWIRRQDEQSPNGSSVHALYRTPIRLNIVRRLRYFYDVKYTKIPQALENRGVSEFLNHAVVPKTSDPHVLEVLRSLYLGLVTRVMETHFASSVSVGRIARGG